MTKRIGGGLVGNRWIASGIFEFLEETKEWEYSPKYQACNIVWEFREAGTMVVSVSGVEKMTLPFSIIDGKLQLDLSAHKPDGERSGSKESYLIEEKENGEIWLHDLETRICEGGWLALILTPEPPEE